jgi:hypothetical protein
LKIREHNKKALAASQRSRNKTSAILVDNISYFSLFIKDKPTFSPQPPEKIVISSGESSETLVDPSTRHH